jgi:fructokinase
MSESRPPTVLCFGEILWDFLPDGLFPGGAPFNVAYHAHQLGLEARIVSAVGRDLLGEELVRRLHDWSIPTDLITRHTGLPTGYVRATIAANGDAHYDITRSVAWDQIVITGETVHVATRAQALVFESLAQRSPFNRNALDRLMAVLPGDAWRVFDVNLRPPFDDLALVRERAARASVLKLNAAEAALLAADEPEAPGREEDHARMLADATGCSTVCITAGSRGAGLWCNGRWTWEPGRPVAVADTVGAGDAFLASLVADLVRGRSADGELLARACRLGEWVATRRGATPAYDSSTPIIKETTTHESV